jgi:hypothetical protein
MSKLVIADLHQVEELSSAQMRQIDGGMSCGEAGHQAMFYYGLGTVYGAMGLDDAAKGANSTANGLIKGHC